MLCKEKQCRLGPEEQMSLFSVQLCKQEREWNVTYSGQKSPPAQGWVAGPWLSSGRAAGSGAGKTRAEVPEPSEATLAKPLPWQSFLLMNLNLFLPLILVTGCYLLRHQWGHNSQPQGGGAKCMVMISNRNKCLTCVTSPSGGQRPDQRCFPSHFRNEMPKLQRVCLFLPESEMWWC